MIRAYAFVGLFLLASIYALARGGSPERLGTAFYVTAYVATIVAAIHRNSAFSGIEWRVFATDALLALALVGLAMYANRYWTIWAASLQIVAVMAHFAKLVVPDIAAKAYAMILTTWSYAALPLLIAGTWRHRSRIKQFGEDLDWSIRAN